MNKIFFLLIILLNIISCNTPKSKIQLVSKYYTDSIYSKSLNEYRKHNIYLPKDFNLSKNYPIIYATDGSSIPNNQKYKVLLDSLIDNRIIMPILFVESHSNNKIADSTSSTYGDGRKIKLGYRNFEYVNSDENTKEVKHIAFRFKNHMNYFKNEFIPHIEKQLNQKKKREIDIFMVFLMAQGLELVSCINTQILLEIIFAFQLLAEILKLINGKQI